MSKIVSEYLLSRVFESDSFSITFPVHTVKVVSDKEVEEIGQLKSDLYGA